jgi:hypothetical protein
MKEEQKQQTMPIHILDIENIYVHIDDGIIICEKNDKTIKSYSEEDLKNAFLEGWIARDGDLPFSKAKNKWFNEFKKQIRLN